MAKNQPDNKKRLRETVIVVFVVISISLLAFQLGTNVADMLEETDNAATKQIPPLDMPTPPAGPTPTLDYSAPVSEMD